MRDAHRLRRPPENVLRQVLTYGRLDFPRGLALSIAPRAAGPEEPNWWVPAVADPGLSEEVRGTIARVVGVVQTFFQVSWE